MKSIKIIIASSILALGLNSCTQSEQITPLRGKVKFETIGVSGKIAGRIASIAVQEGQNVKKGDTLAILDIPEINAKVMQTEGAVLSAKGQLEMAQNGATAEQLKQIEKKLSADKAQLNFAQESHDRLTGMFEDSLISRQQFDEVKMKLAMAKAQVEATQAKKLEVTKGTRAEQISQAQGVLNRALGAKEETSIAAKDKFLIAPSDMTIETISLEEGELLTPGYTIFNGYKKNSVYFRFTIPESKIYDYKINDELTIHNPYTKEDYQVKVLTVKQLAKYADITSTSPLYRLDESIYELKTVAVEQLANQDFYLNSTVLLKQD